jgi:hypothetical protein
VVHDLVVDVDVERVVGPNDQPENENVVMKAGFFNNQFLNCSLETYSISRNVFGLENNCVKICIVIHKCKNV